MARPILMTQTNRTRAEARGLSAPGFTALAAAFALALAFGLGALAPAQAHAAQTTPEQVSVSIPTEVPCALMADGTVVAPSSWTVENEGNVPARLAGASASANYEGLSFSATSSGAVLLKHSNGSTSFDATLLVPASRSLPIAWTVSKVDPAANPGLADAAARGPVELLSASFSFRGQAASPAVSVTGQRAYKSALSASPAALPAGAQVSSAKWYSSVSASGPWSEIAGADSASLSLGKDLIGKYVKCRLEYSGGDFDVPASESAACGPISKASAALSVSVSGTAGDGGTLTASTSGLPSDCSAQATYTWQVSADGKTWSDFAAGDTIVLGSEQVGKYVRCQASAGTDPLYNVSPGVSATLGPVKAKQAFAVYSADDNSLDFYKRYDVPSAGDQFEGKTATAVYTGIETSWYGSSNIPWKGYASAITSAAVVDEGISPASCAYWFYDCSRMTSCDVTNWDTSKVTKMVDMFEGCSSLTTLDVSNFDTSNVKYMSNMFRDCKSLATLDVSGWDTSQVTNMSSMFNGCSSLAALDVSGFDTSNVTSTYRMFSYCKSLATLDVSRFDTSKVSNMSNMFYGCTSLATLDVSRFDTSQVTNMKSMFDFCSSLALLDVSSWDTSQVTSMSSMFNNCKSLATLDVSRFDTSQVTSMSSMFYGCTSLATLDVSRFDTSQVTNMSSMFNGCTSLVSLDASSWNTSKVTNMAWMFNNCKSLATLDVSGWDTSKVTDMSFMFYSCGKLASLNASSFNVSSVTKMSSMFRYCSKLQEVSFGATWKWVGTDGLLPSPSTRYIAGADGLWHAKSDGSAYAPADIPSGKADTYYAAAPTWAGAALSVSGDAKLGSTLRASASGVPAWASLKYQWYRDGSAIDGADSDAYACVPDDLGHKLTCKATEAAGKISGELASEPTAAVGKGTAALSGVLSTYAPTVNSAVKATVSGVPSAGANKLTYTWAVADSASAATWTTVKTTSGTTSTSDSYTPTPAVAGKYLRCTVSGENAYYVLTSCARTSATAVAQGELATGSAKATLSGEAAYGQTLTAKATGLPSGAVAKYQWYRGTTAIPGETSQTYKLAKADIGQQIKCVVTDGSGGYKGSLSSAATNAVAKAKAQASVSISGVAKIDQTLTANVAGLPAGGNTVHYQWAYSHNGGPWTDAGQNSPTYKVTHGIDNKYRVTVTVSGNPCYDVAGATSEAFGPIAKADAAAPTVKVSGTQTIGNRLTASVSGQPRGTTATAYQWQYSSDGGKTWTNSTNDGAKTASMLLQPDGTLGKLYRCAVATANDYYDVPMAYSAATSPIGKGTYGAPTAAIAGGKTIESALTCNVSGQPAGTTSTSYQWQYSSDGKTWKDSVQPDAKSREFTPNYTWVNLYARCVVTTSNDYYDVAQAATAAFGPFGKKTVSVSAALGGSAAAGGTLTCSVSGLPAHGTNAVSYQWQWSSDKSKWTNSSYSDAKTNSLKLQGADVGRYYRCVVSVSGNKYYDVNGSATAASAAIGKGTAPAPTVTVSGGKTYGSSMTATVSGQPSGVTLTSYQWQYSADGGKTWKDSSWAGYNTNKIPAFGSDFEGLYFRCKVTTASSQWNVPDAYSAAFGPLVKGSASSSVAVSGNKANSSTLTANVTGLPSTGTNDVSYQWQYSKDGKTGWTNSAYSDGKSKSIKMQPADAGRYYRCAVTVSGNAYYDVAGSTSEAFGPMATSDWSGLSVSVSGSAVVGGRLAASVSGLPSAGSNSLSYQWQYLASDGKTWTNTAISGGTTSSITLPTGALNTSYRCVATLSNPYYNKATAASAATAKCGKGTAAAPTVTVSGDAEVGSILTASVSGQPAGTTSTTYQWQRADSADGTYSNISGANGSTYKPTDADSGKYLKCSVSTASTYYTVPAAASAACGPVKSLQAFAVYSADDNSLDFYKRYDVPSAGDQFEGKTATAVYTGIETKTYSYNNAPWKDYASTITSTVVIDEGISPVSCAYWFHKCNKLATCDVLKLDTSQVTNMNSMFRDCSALATLDVSNFDTSKVTGMNGMFYSCSSLASLDVSHFDTSNVTDMSYMFRDCPALASLDVSHFDTSSVTSMFYMFYYCTSLTTLDVSHFDTSKVMNMAYMFYYCSSLATLDVSHFDTSKVVKMYYMFDGCTKLQEISFGSAWKWVGTIGYLPTPSSKYIAGADGKWHAKSDGKAYAPASIPSGKADTYYAVMPTAFAVYSADDNSLDFYKRAEVPAVGSTFEGKTATAVYTGIETDVYTFTFDANFNMGSSAPWYGYSGKIDSVSIVDNDIAPSSTAYWFYKLNAMTVCDIKKLDTSKISDMTNMFSGCKKLPSLDLSTWNTSKTTNMGGMFTDCWALASLDVSSFDTSNVTYMVSMFNNCWALASLDVSSFDTSNVTNMTSMFCYCSKLKSLDLSHFNTSQVTKMDAMFLGCSSLTALDLSHFDTSQVTKMDSMFSRCSSLTALDLSHFDTSQVTDMSSMFLKCSELTTLDLSSFKTSDNVKMIYTFDDCEKLSKVKIGANFKWVGGSGHGYLPIPSSSYFADADGKWYALSNGAGYAPSAIPSSKEDTYYASKSLRDAAARSGDEAGDAAEIAPSSAAAQEVAACSLLADGEDETSAAPSVEVFLKLAGDGSRAAGPVAITLSGDAGDAHAVLGKEGAKVALAPGRYLVSCLPAPEADGSMADAPEPFWVDVEDGMGPVEISVGVASRRPAADVQARAAAIESWLAAAAYSVPQADAEALRSAAASALSACQAAEAVSEASDGSE